MNKISLDERSNLLDFTEQLAYPLADITKLLDVFK